MTEEMKQMIEEYVKLNIPILVSLSKEMFKNYTLIDAECSDEFLKGKFDVDGYKTPTWYNEIKTKENDPVNLLIIDNFDKINKDKQKRFIELLKYRKVNSLEIPKNCSIIVLARQVNKESINEEVYSLLAHIS